MIEMDAVRKAIDRLAIELEAKPSFKELEAHTTHQQAFAEDISKDLLSYDVEFRIQALESKFSKDMSESTFNELKELKNERKIN